MSVIIKVWTTCVARVEKRSERGFRGSNKEACGCKVEFSSQKNQAIVWRCIGFELAARHLDFKNSSAQDN